jgi:hypothetical protein
VFSSFTVANNSAVNSLGGVQLGVKGAVGMLKRFAERMVKMPKFLCCVKDLTAPHL